MKYEIINICISKNIINILTLPNKKLIKVIKKEDKKNNAYTLFLSNTFILSKKRNGNNITDSGIDGAPIKLKGLASNLIPDEKFKFTNIGNSTITITVFIKNKLFL